jgi:soluble lytic murein transglycosylase
VTPAAVAATSTTSQADKDALANVIELLRKRRPDEASQMLSAIADPVARKLGEWLILRSDNNNATVERYRAFISANPSWPSQTFLRRRLEAALWDDRREDAVVWSWFENESPVSAKGRLTLAKVMIARGDRTNAERLVRQAWRSDPMSEDVESSALDMFGAFLTAGDHKARMDALLYGTENEAAGTRAAQQSLIGDRLHGVVGEESGRVVAGLDGLEVGPDDLGAAHPTPLPSGASKDPSRSSEALA